MNTYDFDVAVDGIDVADERVEEALAALDFDATLGAVSGQVEISVTIDADDLLGAITEALATLGAAVDDLQVLRVDVDEYVTVGQIAERLGRSRQSVHQLARGDRGAGGFPAAVRIGASGVARLYRWGDAAQWAHHAGLAPAPPKDEVEVVRAVNGLLARQRRADVLRGDHARRPLRRSSTTPSTLGVNFPLLPRDQERNRGV